MPRFTDKWVVDKCMFDYVNGGDCACCGFPHLFAPGGLEGMINAMSDLETDSAVREINAARASPWPPDMRDQIWADRLLLRFKMKKEMRAYRTFLERAATADTTTTTTTTATNDVDDDRAAVRSLHRFCTRDMTPTQLRRTFQLPRSELTETLRDRYGICSAYSVVFCSVVDQVANFDVTGYGVDARRGGGGRRRRTGDDEEDDDDDSEEVFERMLKFDGNAGFRLDVVVPKTTSGDDDRGLGDDWMVDDVALMKFLRRMTSLAGPTLLARAAARRTSSNDEDDYDDREGGGVSGGGDIEKDDVNVTSFRSDRRVIRLMIARYWADRLIEKYNDVQKKKEEEEDGTDAQ